MLIRVTVMLVWFFFYPLSSMDKCAQAGGLAFDWEAHSAFCFLALSHRTSSPDTVEEDAQKVTQNLFLAGSFVQPQETNTEEGMEKQQTFKVLSHASFPFSETLLLYTAPSL